MKRQIIFFILILLIAASLSAQDFDFGFDFDDDGGISFSSGNKLNISINGEVSASMVGYLDDFYAGASSTRLGDIFTGSLSFAANTSVAQGVINLNLETTAPYVSIDEAYLRAYFGDFDITAGLKKLTWGKADSMGPLDVINPLDTSRIYTELADSTSLMGVKIARPLVHASFRFGQSSKIEGVFIPWFEPHTIAETGKWVPAQMKMMSEMIENSPISITPSEPNTITLDYAQAGLRFTTTVGSADIGAQYYYGRLPQPSVKLSVNYATFYPLPIPSSIDLYTLYNPYHQIGLDYAQVLFGFNVRAEFAANITDDLKGNDGSVYNPSIAWSLGFDRDLFWGINLNFQANESIRLMHNKLGSGDFMSVLTNNFDIEGGSKLTATRLTAMLSKKFLHDELEVRTAVVWGIEDNDCAIMPAIIWTRGDLRFAFSGGFFAGDEKGQLGQYRDNKFLKVSLTYMF